MKKPVSTTLRRFGRTALSHLPLATAIHFACFAPAFADADPQQPAPSGDTTEQKAQGLDTITVTAQKRT